MQEHKESANHELNAAAVHPSLQLYVIGITGTNGKTTVSHLIGDALKKGVIILLYWAL
jgi:UDP-N-acetylmuramoylalanine-D-glutamate ligase